MKTSKKRFVTIFPIAGNVHLFKDVGMIPYIMFREYGYESRIVCFQNETYYSPVENELKGLIIEHIPGHKAFSECSWEVVKYIWKNAATIDVLNLYHNMKDTLLYASLFKIKNRKGLIYNKLDISVSSLKWLSDNKGIIHYFRMLGYKLFYKYIIDIVSCEQDTTHESLCHLFPVLTKKGIIIPNGIDDHYILSKQMVKKSADEKEKIILTVGRIGAGEKNHRMLLEAASRLNLNGWKIIFAGPVESDFEQTVNNYVEQKPQLKEHLIFTGNILNREELYSWYNRARVFCLTSLWESFGIVLVEALFFGDYIISTPVGSINFITDNRNIGKIVTNADELADALQSVIEGQIDLEMEYSKAIEQSKKFRWTTILKVLDDKINELTSPV